MKFFQDAKFGSGGSARSAFSGANTAGKLQMLGAAFGGDPQALAMMAQQGDGGMPQTPPQIWPEDMPGMGRPTDQIMADLMRRYGADQPAADDLSQVRLGGFGRRFGFGRY